MWPDVLLSVYSQWEMVLGNLFKQYKKSSVLFYTIFIVSAQCEILQ